MTPDGMYLSPTFSNQGPLTVTRVMTAVTDLKVTLLELPFVMSIVP